MSALGNLFARVSILWLVLLLGVLAFFPAFVFSQCVVPSNGMNITQSVTLCPGTYHLRDGIRIVTSPNVTLNGNGAILEGDGILNGLEVIGSGPDNATIKNLTIRNYDLGIINTNVSSTKIQNVVIDKCARSGIHSMSSPAPAINDCVISNCGGNGIFLGGGQNGTISNNRISNCFRALAILQANNVTVSQNTFTKNDEGIINNSSGVIINNNNIFSNVFMNLSNSNAENIDARMNWWGSTSCEDIRSMFNGNINISTILSSSYPGGSETTCVNSGLNVYKKPIILIPGTGGSELKDSENGNMVWFDSFLADNEAGDIWLWALNLTSDGKTPDTSTIRRCANDFFGPSCGSSWNCLFPTPCLEVEGRELIPGDNLVGFLSSLVGPCRKPYYEIADALNKRLGYTNQELFPLTYDWRKSVYKAADRLKGLIDEIQTMAPDPSKKVSVNIIAHSLGGLVVRAYIEKYSSDPRICTVIYLGAPQIGCPKAFAILNGYKNILNWLGGVFPLINVNTIVYLAKNYPAFYEALPRYDFFQGEGFQQSINRLRVRNSALVDMSNTFYNNQENIFTYGAPVNKSFEIDGSGYSTLKGFKTKDGACMAPDEGNGDSMMPILESGKRLAGTRYYFVNADHGCLPADKAVQEKIIQILEGRENDLVDLNGDGNVEVKDTPFPLTSKKWTGTVCSPAHLRVTDSSGRVCGVEPDGTLRIEIPDSDFYVFEHNESGFMPSSDNYLVEANASGSGTMTLAFEEKDQDGNIVNLIEFSDIPIVEESHGQIALVPDNPDPVLEIDVDGDGTTDFNLQPGSPSEDMTSKFFNKGDVDLDRVVNIADAINILMYLFSTGKITCLSGADVNQDSEIDISDVIRILFHLFGDLALEGLVYCPDA